ncbi:hypothetical protein GCM10022254_10120 [Actinomadura meridiana]|uniref:DUF5709 domain-containing protein n=1 Tax=Actinomadura meridiana TaxID=559626 RepID=A0ABP8BTX2_9ACTN
MDQDQPDIAEAVAPDMGMVDRHPDVHRATEPDEDARLAELYGAPDEDGAYRGEALADSEGGEQ